MALDDNLYFCSIENNDCINKDDCYRYTRIKENNNRPNTTLYKQACTKDNDYILFTAIPKEEIKEGETNEV